jgi:glycosyltransferase involved in cell wall biosynthesis
MIVKNEENNLECCLSNIARFMDEIIIVDTGSTDSTKEIANRYTDKVYDYAWTNDFAAARNFSISKSDNDYVLIIDSDEFLDSVDIQQIKRLVEENPGKIGRLLRRNEYTRNGIPHKYSERVNRLFSKKYYQYEGIIHEQVVPMLQKEAGLQSYSGPTSSAGGTYLIPLTIRHSGYEGDLETRKKKTERNISLLKQAQLKNPEDPYILYQLGKSYYMEEDYLTACDYLGQALYFDLNPQLEYVQDLVESYGYCLLNSGQYDTALQMLNIYDEFAHSADFVFLIALILMNNGKFKEAIEEFIKAAGKTEAKMEGVNGYLAYYNIGVIYECMRDNVMARKYYEMCNGYEAAKQRLNQIR